MKILYEVVSLIDFFLVMYVLFKERIHTERRKMIILLFIIGILLIISAVFKFDHKMALVDMIICMLIVVLMMEGNVIDKVLGFMITFAVQSMICRSVLFLISPMMHNWNFSYGNIDVDVTEHFITMVILGIFAIWRRNKSITLQPGRLAGVMVFLSAFIFTGILEWIEQYVKENNVWLISMLVLFFLTATLMSIVLIVIDSMRKSADKENRLSRMYTASLLTYLDEISERDERIRHMNHDTRHHLAAIRRLAQSGDNGEIVNYLNRYIDETEDVMSGPFDSGNKVMNAVIMEKSTIAAKQGINISCCGCLYNKQFIEDFDMCIIVSNLLDNAVGEGMITAEMTEAQAQSLQENEDIKCVEMDFEIEPYEEAGEEMVKPLESDWAIEAVNADALPNTNSVIKVAILDSGVDCTDNVDVKERKNFISDMPVTTPLFEDTCGHGTSVASVICGMGRDSNVVGTNNNVELYSARVLDNNKQAPISRIVQAIYWAIEKDVDIINISFGTQTYSESLKTAIDDAVNAGILVVAAAGNHGIKGVDYPAAFDNTLAVGAINATGGISDFSSIGDKIDVVAPGEAVEAQGNFGEDLVLSGTSLSAPYVAGIASLIWSNDKTKDSEFISTLIKLSAKKM